MKKANTINPLSLGSLLFIGIALSACGGGGGSSDVGGEEPPQAKTFQAQLTALTFNEGVEVVVDANDLPLGGPTITFEEWGCASIIFCSSNKTRSGNNRFSLVIFS